MVEERIGEVQKTHRIPPLADIPITAVNRYLFPQQDQRGGSTDAAVARDGPFREVEDSFFLSKHISLSVRSSGAAAASVGTT